MKLHLDVRELPWDFHKKKDPPHVQALRERLNAIFAAYKPRRLTDGRFEWTHELTVPVGDAQIDSLLKQFDKEIRAAKQPVAAAAVRFLEPAEVKRARYFALCLYGDDVDVNNYEEPLNAVALACEVCKFPDVTRVPNPLLVNKSKVKKQDIQKANTVLIVRPAVLELLRGAIGDQIEVGDVRYVVKGKPDAKTPSDDERLYWVRPKAVLGAHVWSGFTVKKRCPACDRVVDCDQQMYDEQRDAQGPGVQDTGSSVQHFGDTEADLAVIPPRQWMEDADHTKQRHWSVNFAISGALFEQLKGAKVKGIGYSEAKVAYTSAKGEPAFDSTPRAFGGGKPAANAKPAKTAKPATASSNAAAALKDVPWDCDDKGYVYFELSTPEILILDPMTWEQDDSGPHRVKKFKKPGLYRMPVSAIKSNDNAGVAVDSATILFIDGAFFADLQEVYDWDKACGKGGKLSARYHQALAEQIGTRFGLCTTPPKKFKSEFVGDGQYTIDPKQIEPAP